MESEGDVQPFRGLPLRAAVLCCLFMVVQGVDTYGISYVAPLLGADFGIAPPQIGMLFAVSVIASFAGATVIAPLSDRYGRRRVLLASVLLTGAPSVFIPMTNALPVLLLLRVIVGLGFGAALPVALALVSDLAPVRFRARLLTLTTTSIVVGMSLSGLAASMIVPRHGWQFLLYSSGTACVATVLLGMWLLPESQPSAARVSRTEAPALGGWRTLLEPGTLLRSALFCLVLATSYMVLNFAVYWLPTVILNEGYSLSEAGFIGSSRQLFTVALSVFVGFCMDRLGGSPVLLVCQGIAMVLLVATAGLSPFATISLVVLLAGMSLLSASVTGLLALISGSYAAPVRATALGWVLGTSRVAGGTIGTYVGGVLLGAGWDQQQLATAAGLAAAVGLAALVAALSLARRDQRKV